eukprot:6198379-Pleurochrysis_carterae.AAC.2
MLRIAANGLGRNGQLAIAKLQVCTYCVAARVLPMTFTDPVLNITHQTCASARDGGGQIPMQTDA